VTLPPSFPAVLAPIMSSVIPAVLRILLILVLAFVLNRLVRRAIRGFVQDVKEQGIAKFGALRRGPLARTGPLDLTRATMRTETVGTVLRSIATVIIYTIAVVLILDQVGLEIGPLIAGAGIVGIALGFGAQSVVKDFLSGLFILLEDQYGVGDIVDLGEGQTPVTGVVESITLRVTQLRDVTGTVWYIPNGELRAVGNKSDQWVRTLIEIGVSHNDLRHAETVIKRVAEEVQSEEPWSSIILEPAEIVGFENLGPDQTLIRLGVKTEPTRQLEVNRELRMRINQAFHDEGIGIPPSQTATT
jgi:small-conductance mechanosensitive channel